MGEVQTVRVSIFTSDISKMMTDAMLYLVEVGSTHTAVQRGAKNGRCNRPRHITLDHACPDPTDLLQDLLRRAYFQFLSGTPTRMLLFVVNSKLTYFPHQIDYRICAAYIVFIVLSVRRC